MERFSIPQLVQIQTALNKIKVANSDIGGMCKITNVKTFEDAGNFYMSYTKTYAAEGGPMSDLVYVKIDRAGKEEILNYKNDVHKLAELFKTLTAITL